MKESGEAVRRPRRRSPAHESRQLGRHPLEAALFKFPSNILIYKLVYLNGNNAAEGENNIKYANSYPMNLTVKNWFAQDIFESLW